MFSFYEVAMVMLLHWVADFILQTLKQSRNKSKSNKYLTAHVATYTAILFLMCFRLGLLNGSIWALVNGAAHWCTDWATSRMTSHLWTKGDVHNFFVVIGFDQMIHLLTLLATYLYFRA